MSAADLIKKLERELELNQQLTSAKESNLKETLAELMRNPDIKAQAAKELKTIMLNRSTSNRPKVEPAGGFSQHFEQDSDIQPLSYDDNEF